MTTTIADCIQFAENDGLIDGATMDQLFAELNTLRGNTCDKVWQRGTPHAKRCILWAGHEKAGQPHRPDGDGELTSQHDEVVVVETPIDDEEGETVITVDRDDYEQALNLLRRLTAELSKPDQVDWEISTIQELILEANELLDGPAPANPSKPA